MFHSRSALINGTEQKNKTKKDNNRKVIVLLRFIPWYILKRKWFSDKLDKIL